MVGRILIKNKSFCEILNKIYKKGGGRRTVVPPALYAYDSSDGAIGYFSLWGGGGHCEPTSSSESFFSDLEKTTYVCTKVMCRSMKMYEQKKID